MSIDNRNTLTQEQSDSRAVPEYAFKGKTIDPAIVKRVRARAATVCEGMRKGGETNSTLDLLHESRDE